MEGWREFGGGDESRDRYMSSRGTRAIQFSTQELVRSLPPSEPALFLCISIRSSSVVSLPRLTPSSPVFSSVLLYGPTHIPSCLAASSKASLTIPHSRCQLVPTPSIHTLDPFCLPCIYRFVVLLSALVFLVGDCRHAVHSCTLPESSLLKPHVSIIPVWGHPWGE